MKTIPPDTTQTVLDETTTPPSRVPQCPVCLVNRAHTDERPTSRGNRCIKCGRMCCLHCLVAEEIPTTGMDFGELIAWSEGKDIMVYFCKECWILKMGRGRLS